MPKVVYRLLGPLEVVSDGSSIALGNGTQRELFTLLLLDAERSVSVERLIDSLWDEPPASAAKIIQNCVVRLRRVLPSGVVETHRHGYVLRVAAADTDLGQFNELVEQAQTAAGMNEPVEVARLLTQALALWRGPALADVRESTALRIEAERLDELRLGALADRIDADLATGRHEQVVAELTRLVASHPLRERLRAQLMLALYRSGRQADALNVYRVGRAEMVDQLGVEPGPALKQLEQSILNQDKAIAAPPTTHRANRATGVTGRLSTRRRRLVVAAAGVVVLAAIAIAWAVRPSSGPETHAAGQLLAVNTSSARISAHVPTGTGPVGIAFADGQVFVVNQASGTVSVIDLHTLAAGARDIAITSNNLGGLTSIAVSAGEIWAIDGTSGTLTSITPTDFSIGHANLFHVGAGSDYMTLAGGQNVLWATSDLRHAVIAFDPMTETLAWETRVLGEPIAAIAGANAVWCISGVDTEYVLSRIDPRRRRVVARVRLPGSPSAITYGLGSIWVAVPSRGVVVRVDPGTNSVTDAFAVGNLPVAIAVSGRRLWVATAANHKLLSFDPTTHRETSTTDLGRVPHIIAAAAGRIWIITG